MEITKRIKEVTVFTDGDSRLMSTWSNVPFFFTEALRSMGIIVNRVNITHSVQLEKVYGAIIFRTISQFNKRTSYTYRRSHIHFWATRNKIAKAIKQHHNSDAFIFISFCFSAVGLTNKPIIQFHDWTYEYEFNYFHNRDPDFLERQSIKREDSQIKGADLVFVLFPGVADYMQRRYMDNKVYYLGNVINSLYKGSEDDINNKDKSNSLLFVGSIKYIDGAKALVASFESLKKDNPLLTLDIVGITQNELEHLPTGVFCHGYLDKGDDSQRNLYYDICKRAKIFINTTPKWGSFSASIEAMYFYTPVIVSPYSEFVQTFGQDIDFGQYCEHNEVEFINEAILSIMNSDRYRNLCLNAHNAVKDFTWDAYMKKLVQKIEELP